MINALFNTPNYVAAKKHLDLTVLRHEAIANNLANVETPNYKRIDIAPGFAEALRRAAAAKQPETLQALKPQWAVDTTRAASRRDGNTVDLESELAELNKNFMAHTLETQLISGTLSSLKLAITGRQV